MPQRRSAPQNLLSDHLLSNPSSRDLNAPSLRGAPRMPEQRQTSCPGLPWPSAAAHSLGHPNAPLNAQDEGRKGIWKSHPTPSLGQPLPGFLFLPGRGWRVRKGLVRQENSGAGGEQSHARGERNQWEPRVFWTRKALGPQGALPDTGTWPNARSSVDLEWAASQAVTCALGACNGPPGSEPLFPPCWEQITSTG